MTARIAIRTALERQHRIRRSYHATRLGAGLGAALALCACAGAAPFGFMPGASSAPRAAADRSRSVSARSEPRWPGYDAALSWPPVTRLPFVARDHAGGRYRARVRVSPGARSAYANWVRGQRMPPRTVIAMFHWLRDQRGPVYVMSKRASGAWRFLVLAPDGHVLHEPTALCRRCHAEAPADDVFGPVRGGESPRAGKR